MPQPQAPLVHLNGTGRYSLSEGYSQAYRALQKAIIALNHTAPHPRDYYPLPEGAYAKAEREHQQRWDRLVAVREQLHELWRAVQDQSPVDAEAGRGA